MGEPWDPAELLKLRDVEWSPPWGRPGGSIEHARALLEEHLGRVDYVVIRDRDDHALLRRDPPGWDVYRGGVVLGRIDAFPFDVLRFRGTRTDGMRLEGEVHGMIRFVPSGAIGPGRAPRQLRPPHDERSSSVAPSAP